MSKTEQLTQSQRDAMIAQVLKNQDDNAATLAALGHTKKATHEYKTSPDGGPPSHAHRFLKANLLPTMQVVNRTTGATCLISKKRYDPELYERVEPVGKRARTPLVPQVEDKPAVIVISDLPRGEMLRLSMTKLMALPEVAHIPSPPKDKTKLVDAICGVREELAES